MNPWELSEEEVTSIAKPSIRELHVSRARRVATEAVKKLVGYGLELCTEHAWTNTRRFECPNCQEVFRRWAEGGE